jgi:hypothetical protein
MKEKGWRAKGRELTHLPIQVFAYDRRSQVKLVGLPAAIFSFLRTIIKK